MMMKIRIKREHHRVYLEGSRNCAVHTKWQKIQSGSGYAAIRNKKSSMLYMYVCVYTRSTQQNKNNFTMYMYTRSTQQKKTTSLQFNINDKKSFYL
jgi:hypothetical protein